MNVELNKKEVEFILTEVECVCDSNAEKENIYTFKEEDYGGLTQSELNTMKSLKEKLERGE